MIEGKKLWFIFPKLYNNHIENNIEEFKGGDILAFVNNIYKTDYKPLVCIQKPGHLLYIPGDYYHAVINLGTTVSLTESFFNEINYDKVRAFFRVTKKEKNILAIESIIKEGFLKIKKQIYERIYGRTIDPARTNY